MSNQTFGTARVSLHKDFAAYDQLPRPIRDMLKYSVADWSALHILKDMRTALKAGFSIEDVCFSIRKMLARDQPEQAYRAYGPDHPEADNHGRRLRPAKFAAWGTRR